MGATGVLPLEAEDFLVHLQVEKGRSVLTLDAYRRDLGRYTAFLDGRGHDVAGATGTDVADYARSLRAAGLAASSSTRMMVSVRTLHRWLAAEGRRHDDPTLGVENPRLAEPLPKALSEEQVMALLETLEAAVEATRAAAATTPDDAAARRRLGTDRAFALRDRALLETLYGTGARVSEVCGLRFGDVDLDGRLMRVLGKRAKERVVPLGRHAVRTLGEWLDDGRDDLAPARWRSRDDADAVFLGSKGTRLTRQGAWLVLSKRSAEAGLATAQLSPHVLRHSCATHLLDHGADIRSVQELLGHASVSTTQRYTKVATERLFQAYRDAHPRSGATPHAGVSRPT
jgi:integrase/recombinase XerD